MGLARPLSRALLTIVVRKTSRRLTVRYDGFAQVTLRKLATGSAPLIPTMRAFPVPGRLAGSHPTFHGWLLD